MPIEYEIRGELKLIDTTVSGAVTTDEIANYQNGVWRRPAIKGFNELLDLRQADLSQISFDNLKEISERSSRNDIGAEPSKTAVITATLHDQQLADFFQALREMLPANVRTIRHFKDDHEARNWIFS